MISWVRDIMEKPKGNGYVSDEVESIRKLYKEFCLPDNKFYVSIDICHRAIVELQGIFLRCINCLAYVPPTNAPKANAATNPGAAAASNADATANVGKASKGRGKDGNPGGMKSGPGAPKKAAPAEFLKGNYTWSTEVMAVYNHADPNKPTSRYRDAHMRIKAEAWRQPKPGECQFHLNGHCQASAGKCSVGAQSHKRQLAPAQHIFFSHAHKFPEGTIIQPANALTVPPGAPRGAYGGKGASKGKDNGTKGGAKGAKAHVADGTVQQPSGAAAVLGVKPSDMKAMSAEDRKQLSNNMTQVWNTIGQLDGAAPAPAGTVGAEPLVAAAADGKGGKGKKGKGKGKGKAKNAL